MFMVRMYSLNRESPKNQQELPKCANELDLQPNKIGRILGTRLLYTVNLTTKNMVKVQVQPNKPCIMLKLNTRNCPNFHRIWQQCYEVFDELSILSKSFQNRNTTSVQMKSLEEV